VSLKVFGVFHIDNSAITVDEIVRISFSMVQKAIKKNVGIKLGGSITQSFLDRYENISQAIPFELTDNLMEESASCLFSGDVGSVKTNSIHMCTNESLESRMFHVQNFLGELLKIKEAKKIVLDINTKEEVFFETIKISVENYCKAMLELYEKNNNMTPVMRIVLKKTII